MTSMFITIFFSPYNISLSTQFKWMYILENLALFREIVKILFFSELTN